MRRSHANRRCREIGQTLATEIAAPLRPSELVQSVERRGLVALGQSRVVKDRVDEILHRSLEDHHGLADVQQLAGAVTDDVDPQDLAGLTMEDQLEASGGVAADLAAGDL